VDQDSGDSPVFKHGKFRFTQCQFYQGGSVSKYEYVTLILQALVAIATFGALFVYYRQLRVMSRQLVSMQETSRAQSGLSLVDFLQEQDVREARHTVRAVLSTKPMEHWTETEKDHASRVTAN